MAGEKHSRLLRGKTIDLIRLYLIFSAVGLVYAFAAAYLTAGNSIQGSLFWNGAYSDHFMDFFNTLRDSRDLSFIYQRGLVYPPLSVLMTWFFSRFVPAESFPRTFNERYEMQFDPHLNTVYLIFCILCVLCMVMIIERFCRDQHLGRERIILPMFCIVSFPMIYCVERGNTTLFAACACAFFVFFRNSERKAVREISLILLAIAAGIKLFPAVFGMLLIYDKKYFAAGRAVFYGLMCIALPYGMMKLLMPEADPAVILIPTGAAGTQGNIAAAALTAKTAENSLTELIGNITRFIEKRSFYSYSSKGIANVFYLLYAMGILPPGFAKGCGMVAFLVSEAVMLAAGFFCKKEWQRVFICGFLLLNVHSISIHYALIYLIPALLLFLVQENNKKNALNIVYLCLFSLQFVTIPFVISEEHSKLIRIYWRLKYSIAPPESLNEAASWPAFHLLAAIVLVDIVFSVINEKKRAKHDDSYIQVRRARSIAG